MKKTYQLFLLLTACAGCAENRTEQQADSAKASHKIRIDSPAVRFDISDAISDMSVISLETNDTTLISGINKVLVVDSVYYVVDKKFKSILRYSPEGRLLGSVGRIGGDLTAGEYQEISDLIYHPGSDKLWVYSNTKPGILEYTKSGKFLRSVRTNLYTYMAAASDSLCYYYVNNNASDYSRQFNFIITDTSRRIRERSFPMSDNVTESIAFSGALVSGKDYTLLNTYLDNIIYKIEGMKVSPEFEIDFGKHAMPASVKKSEHILSGKIDDYGYLSSSIAMSSGMLAFGYYFNHTKGWAVYNPKNQHLATRSATTALPVKLTNARFNETEGGLISSLPNADGFLKLDVSQSAELAKRFPSLSASLERIRDPSNPLLVLIRLKDF